MADKEQKLRLPDPGTVRESEDEPYGHSRPQATWEMLQERMRTLTGLKQLPQTNIAAHLPYIPLALQRQLTESVESLERFTRKEMEAMRALLRAAEQLKISEERAKQHDPFEHQAIDGALEVEWTTEELHVVNPDWSSTLEAPERKQTSERSANYDKDMFRNDSRDSDVTWEAAASIWGDTTERLTSLEQKLEKLNSTLLGRSKV